MKIVVDTNILFSYFREESFTRKLLINSSYELISPEIALEEIKKYSKEIINKQKISEIKFKNYLSKLKETIKFIKKEEYANYLSDADMISPDKKDSKFLALCLKNSCILWSNDSALKNQSKVKVFSTEEIIEILF